MNCTSRIRRRRGIGFSIPSLGVRELTYELSLFDHEGRLRRVEVDPTLGTLHGERLIDVRHEPSSALRKAGRRA